MGGSAGSGAAPGDSRSRLLTRVQRVVSRRTTGTSRHFNFPQNGFGDLPPEGRGGGGGGGRLGTVRGYECVASVLGPHLEPPPTSA